MASPGRKSDLPACYPSVRIFISETFLGNLLGDFFHIAHTHPLGSVDVPFGGYDLLVDLHILTKIALIAGKLC